MNRHARRAAVKQARQQNGGLAKVVAVHEAGHAVARYLTAEELGHDTEDAIFYIEVGFVAPRRASFDGKAMLSSSAVTFGPMYSRPMIDYLKRNPVLQDHGATHPVTIQTQVDACKAAGIDVAEWAALKTFICMAATAAEAKFTGRPIEEVANSYQCEDDLRDAMRDCLLAGMTTAEATNVVNNVLDHAEEVFADPRVWAAVLAVADSLPAVGRVEGRQVAAIIRDALFAA
jgi:hypothetical protein